MLATDRGVPAARMMLLLTILLTIGGCQGGSGGQPAGADVGPLSADAAAPGFDTLLPSPQELAQLTERREVSYEPYRLIKHGSDYHGTLPSQNVAESGDSAQFSPSFGPEHGRTLANIAYCCYAFTSIDNYYHENEVNYGWDIAPSDMDTAWLAVSDFRTNEWRWLQCNASGHSFVSNLDLHFNQTTELLFVGVFLATDEPVRLRYVRLGAPTVEAKIHTSPNRGFTPLECTFDAGGSTVGVGSIAQYEWDWGDDGDFEQSTGGTPTADHSYAAIGAHTAAVRVTSSYGVQDTAAMEVLVADRWTHSWGTALDERIEATCTDSQLNCYGAGWMETADGDDDLLLLKWDLAGDLVWARAWGGIEDEKAVDILASGDKLYVLGETQSFGAGGADILLQCWGDSGELEWSRTWGGDESDHAEGFSWHEGNVYVAGMTRSFGHQNGDALVLKCDLDGGFPWARTVGGNATDRALDALAFKPFSVPYAGVHVAGDTATYSSAGSAADILYLRFSPDGTLVEMLTWAGGVNQSATAVSVSGLFGEEVYVAGHNPADALLLEVGTGGGLLAKAWDSGDTERAWHMLRSGDSFLICGKLGEGGSEEDAFLLNLSLTGAVQSLQRWDLANEDEQWLGIGSHAAGVVLGGSCLRADGGSWSDLTGTVSDIAGTWTEQTVTPGEPVGTVGEPSAAARDVTGLGTIDSGGGGTLDALMSAH